MKHEGESLHSNVKKLQDIQGAINLQLNSYPKNPLMIAYFKNMSCLY